MPEIDFSWYVRTPFAVEAVRITEQNIEQVAELVGEVKTKGDERYIALDRRIVPNIGRAHIGWYLTRLGDNLRCYNSKIFQEQFIDMPSVQPVTFKFTYGGDEDPSVTLVDDANTGRVVSEVPFGAGDQLDPETQNRLEKEREAARMAEAELAEEEVGTGLEYTRTSDILTTD